MQRDEIILSPACIVASIGVDAFRFAELDDVAKNQVKQTKFGQSILYIYTIDPRQ